nr:hypothetical protein [Tanacetum cinerariifolium]
MKFQIIHKSIHPLSGSNTSSSYDSIPSLTSFETSDSLLEEFIDELAQVDSFPSEKDDDLFDFEDNNDEWRNIFYPDPFDDIQSDDDDDLFDFKFDNDEWKKLFDSTLPEESSEIATLLSSPFENEDKVFNPGILILGGTQIFNDESKYKDFKVNTLFEALIILEERNFLLICFDQELLFHLELTMIETLLSFSSKNEDKVFNPGILTSKGVHSFTLKLSHRTYETFKIVNVHTNILNEGPMKIFPFFCFCPKDKGIRGESS